MHSTLSLVEQGILDQWWADPRFSPDAPNVSNFDCATVFTAKGNTQSPNLWKWVTRKCGITSGIGHICQAQKSTTGDFVQMPFFLFRRQ